MDTVREPCVSGRFYPANAGVLRHTVQEHLGDAVVAVQRAAALVVPHAGYVYSGGHAGRVYARASVPRRVILLGPNHTGRGSPRAVWQRGAWNVPGACVPIDDELADLCMSEAGLEADQDAHMAEHSLEVHLPFLLARRPDVTIVPICLGSLTLSECLGIGRALARIVAAAATTEGSRILLVASTDMSHYVNADVVRSLDQPALDRIVSMDAAGLHDVVRDHRISMCGYVPTTVALAAAVSAGSRQAQLVTYGNSGETSGDFTRVVGYAGFLIE